MCVCRSSGSGKGEVVENNLKEAEYNIVDVKKTQASESGVNISIPDSR